MDNLLHNVVKIVAYVNVLKVFSGVPDKQLFQTVSNY